MTWVDVAILVIVALSALVSVVRGFLREALSLAGWILAIWVSLSFTDELSARLVEHIDLPALRQGVAFVALFVSVLLVTGIVNFAVGKLVDKTGLTGTDRVLGVVFGVVRGVLVVVILVVLAGLTDFPEDRWWRDSMLLPRLEVAAAEIRSTLPPEVAERLDY